MKNIEIKSRENLSNGELFVLEKVTEIVSQVHDKLTDLGIIINHVPIDYPLKISREIYNKLDSEIKDRYNLSRPEKGKKAIQEIKGFIKNKVELEINLMLAHTGKATAEEKNLVSEVVNFIENIELAPLSKNIKPKNLAWNYD